MTTKTLGNSDLAISPIDIGTWAIGGDGVLGWGPQDDADSIAAIQRGVELGLNWIDTAPIYGFEFRLSDEEIAEIEAILPPSVEMFQTS